MPVKKAVKRVTKTGVGPRGRSHMQAPKRAARRVPKPYEAELHERIMARPGIKKKLGKVTRPSRGPASRSHMRRS